VHELDLLIAERPPPPVTDAEATATARRALVAHVDARRTAPERAPGSSRRHVAIAVAAAVLLVVAAAGALALLPGRGDPPSEEPTYALSSPEAEVDATYTFSFSPSPDLPPDPDAPQGSSIGPPQPLRLVAADDGRFEVESGGPDVLIPPMSVLDLTGGQAPFRLEPPATTIEVGGRWEFPAAPLHTGGDALDGSCAATLRDVTDDDEAVVDVACTWPSDTAGTSPVASSEETWLLDADGHVLSWRQRLTPTGSEQAADTRLVQVSPGNS
jgi:hypothetical protein